MLESDGRSERRNPSFERPHQRKSEVAAEDDAIELWKQYAEADAGRLTRMEAIPSAGDVPHVVESG